MSKRYKLTMLALLVVLGFEMVALGNIALAKYEDDAAYGGLPVMDVSDIMYDSSLRNSAVPVEAALVDEEWQSIDSDEGDGAFYDEGEYAEAVYDGGEYFEVAYDDGYTEVVYDDGGYAGISTNGGWVSGEDFKYNGLYHDDGFTYTYYSESVLPGGGLDIPGRHVNEEGYICDENGNLCVASDDYSCGTVVDVPFGTGTAVVYDSGSGYGNIDFYVSW